MDTEKRNSVNSRATTIPALPAAYIRLGALVALGLAAFFVGRFVMNRGGDEAPAWRGRDRTSKVGASELRGPQLHPVYWAAARTTSRTSSRARPTAASTCAISPKRHGCRRSSRTLPDGRHLSAHGCVRGAQASGARRRGGQPQARARRPRSLQRRAPDERVLRLPPARYQVEVFHPSASEARRLALAGQVVPVR